MTASEAERLTTLDATFLTIETDSTHMHVGGIALLEIGALRSADGGVDIGRVRSRLDAITQSLRRLRQRVMPVPGLSHWVWVDDEHFDIAYHVRHTALPAPGSQEQLEALAGRIFSGRLDRERPLWEFWIVEGVGADSFALIAKIHHCLLDGVGAVNLIAALAGATSATPDPCEPSAPPRPIRLLAAEVRHRLGGVQRTIHSARETLGRLRSGGETHLQDIARGAISTLGSGLRPATATRLNPQHLSPHRRYAMFDTSLAQIRAIRSKLGGTVNDVVLATVTGGLRHYFERHGDDVAALTPFRALIPANTRQDASAASLGNHVSLLLANLPLGEPDTRVRYEKLCVVTKYLKSSSHQTDAAELMELVDDEMGLGLVGTAFRLAARLRSFNVVVTNVPGPQFELDLIDARVRSIHALVPLFDHQGVGIALFSYNGTLHWGLNADWDAVCDLDALVGDLRRAFADLAFLADA